VFERGLQLPFAALGLGFLALLAGCARFQPAPLSPEQSARALESRTLSDPGLRRFLETNGAAPGQWPLTAWDFERLTLAAFHFHPSLAVARAQWSAARAGEIRAGTRPNPTLSAGPQYALNPAQGVTPWLAMVDFDLPIETAGKRGYRMAQARHLAAAARQGILTAAWQARGNLRAALLDRAAAAQRGRLLRRQIELQEQALQRLTLKIEAGALAGSEALPHRVLLQRARLELGAAARQELEARARTAEALGLPLAALEPVELPESMPDLAQAADRLSAGEARRLALESRADIRAALAEYEAASAALQLEVARQYPDLKLGPGYEYDQGENKIGLMLGVELPLFNRNEGAIAEAQARRAEIAARFVALQARVLAAIDLALANCRLGGEQLKEAEALVASQRRLRESVQRQLDGGTVEPSDLLNAEIEWTAAELARHEAAARRDRALADLEDAIQHPLSLPVAALEDPKAEPPWP